MQEQLVAMMAAAKSATGGSVQQTSNQFHWLDYVVFALFLVGSASIGIFFSLTGGRQKTTKEYLMGDRNMQLVPVAISILVSFTSAILILGSPAEIYLNGVIYFYYSFGMAIACVLSAIIFVPLFFPLKLTSAFEYLEKRFNSRAVRIIGNLLYILKGIVYMGIAMFAPSTAMEQVTGGTIKKEYAIIMSGVIGTFYTMLGGLKAVVWTDVFQAGVMLAGVLGIFIKATVDAGGFGPMFSVAERYDRIVLWEDSLDPTERHTIWGLVLGSAIGWVGTFGVNQAAVQRFCSLPTLSKARWSVLINIPGSLILSWASFFAGLAIFGYYASIGCDIFGVGWAGKNQIVPYYVMDRMNFPSFPGLFVAALFSGALSSISSSLNACSAIIWKDILQPIGFFAGLKETTATIITKLLVLAFGVLGTGMGFMAITLGGTVLQASLSFSGAIGGPSLGLFLLGACFPFANWVGAVIGPVVGILLSLWISIGAYSADKQEIQLPANISNCNTTGSPLATFGTTHFTTAAPAPTLPPGLDAFYSISYLWYPAVGTFAAVIAGIIFSGIAHLAGVREEVDHRYLFPIVHRFCCCCPLRCRTVANCGLGEDEILHEGEVVEEVSVSKSNSQLQQDSVELQSVDKPAMSASNSGDGASSGQHSPASDHSPASGHSSASAPDEQSPLPSSSSSPSPSPSRRPISAGRDNAAFSAEPQATGEEEGRAPSRTAAAAPRVSGITPVDA